MVAILSSKSPPGTEVVPSKRTEKMLSAKKKINNIVYLSIAALV